ncbi:MAG: hypothetical protein JO353_01810, partial [Phycisphaerae bacterium]|nr:hypothetical protein [Phycisphaerae bacterium]
QLLPKSIQLPISSAAGEVTLSAAATVDRSNGITLERFAVNTTSARFSGAV